MTLEREEVQQKLVEIALERMESGGLEAVKARDVAKAAGISVGSLYNMFGNVDGLILAACKSIFDDLDGVARESLVHMEHKLATIPLQELGADTPEGEMKFRLMELSRFYLRFVGEYNNRWASVLAFNRSRAATLDQAYVSKLQDLIGIIGSMFSLTPIANDRDKVFLTARAMWSSVHGIVTMNYVGQISEESKFLTMVQIEIFVEYFVRGIFSDRS